MSHLVNPEKQRDIFKNSAGDGLWVFCCSNSDLDMIIGMNGGKKGVSEFLWFQNLLALKLNMLSKSFLYPADVVQIKKYEFSHWRNSAFPFTVLAFLRETQTSGVYAWGKIVLFIFFKYHNKIHTGNHLWIIKLVSNGAVFFKLLLGIETWPWTERKHEV